MSIELIFRVKEGKPVIMSTDVYVTTLPEIEHGDGSQLNPLTLSKTTGNVRRRID